MNLVSVGFILLLFLIATPTLGQTTQDTPVAKKQTHFFEDYARSILKPTDNATKKASAKTSYSNREKLVFPDYARSILKDKSSEPEPKPVKKVAKPSKPANRDRFSVNQFRDYARSILKDGASGSSSGFSYYSESEGATSNVGTDNPFSYYEGHPGFKKSKEKVATTNRQADSVELSPFRNQNDTRDFDSFQKKIIEPSRYKDATKDGKDHLIVQ